VQCYEKVFWVIFLNITRGVRQGGVLSPFLFSIYMDELICKLRSSEYGLYIGNVFTGCILYADDIMLLACSCFGLQRLVDICIIWKAVGYNI